MERLKELAIALSLANLCFLAYWLDLGASPYFQQQPATANDVAVLADVVLLGLVLWVFYSLAKSSRSTFALDTARCAFIIVLLIPLNALRHHLPGVNTEDLLRFLTKSELILLCIVLGAISAYVVVRWRRRIIRILALLVLILSPAITFTFGRVLVRWYTYKSADWSESHPISGVSSTRPPSAHRVLWIVFDEMDERLTFIDRPAGLRLPEIDRLQGESLSAVNAYPPAGNTLLSMPSLINGRVVKEAKPKGSRDLLLTYSGSPDVVNWRNTPNVFAKARDLGFKTALVGWALPYGRVIGSSLGFCQCFPYRPPDSELPFLATMVKQFAFVPSLFPFLDQMDWLNPTWLSLNHQEMVAHIKTFHAFHQIAVPMATNPDFNLVLIHWPTPHLPGIYNRFRGDFDDSGKGTYVDNLALVDRALGEIRHAMEAKGVWDCTTVLVTSDHWFRESMRLGGKTDHRIPFMLKLAGQTKRLDYTPTLNTVVTHDLILAILKRELCNPESVAQWLDQRSRASPQ